MNKRIYKTEEVTIENIAIINDAPHTVTNEIGENVTLGDIVVATYSIRRQRNGLIGYISKTMAQKWFDDNERIIKTSLDKEMIDLCTNENIGIQEILVKFNEYEKEKLMELVSTDSNESPYDAMGL